MKAVHGVLFSEEERQEIARAERWIGVHPEADEPAVKSKRARDVRGEIAAVLHSVTDGTEPVFGERLDRVRFILRAILGAAVEQSEASYWTARGVAAGSGALDVLTTSRGEAVRDLNTALTVLDAAVPYAAHVRAIVDEDEGPR
jgi:hypothetical protein